MLLLRIRSPEGVLLWIAPGGGIEGDELQEEALRRELEEEVGLVGCEIGPLVGADGRRSIGGVGA